MADSTRRNREVPTTGLQQSEAPFAAGSMMQSAVSNLSPTAVRQKIARRLAKRASETDYEGPALKSTGSEEQPALKASDIAQHGFSGSGSDVPHRAEMEQSFGTSFAGVKAHTGGAAAEANTALNSHAYAMGNQVAFKSDNPDKATVAHELTHVLQHTGGMNRRGMDTSDIDTAGETEAYAVEAAVASGREARTALKSAGGGGGGGSGPAMKANVHHAPKAHGSAHAAHGSAHAAHGSAHAAHGSEHAAHGAKPVPSSQAVSLTGLNSVPLARSYKIAVDSSLPFVSDNGAKLKGNLHGAAQGAVTADSQHVEYNITGKLAYSGREGEGGFMRAAANLTVTGSFALVRSPEGQYAAQNVSLGLSGSASLGLKLPNGFKGSLHAAGQNLVSGGSNNGWNYGWALGEVFEQKVAQLKQWYDQYESRPPPPPQAQHPASAPAHASPVAAVSDTVNATATAAATAGANAGKDFANSSTVQNAKTGANAASGAAHSVSDYATDQANQAAKAGTDTYNTFAGIKGDDAKHETIKALSFGLAG